MEKLFSEILIEGPFVLVKGFLLGFLHGSKKEFKYFFHRRHGIRRETFNEFIKELFEIDNYVHLCLENEIMQDFLDAIEKSNKKIGLEVKSIRNIKSANFSYSYEIFNKALAKETKKIFAEYSSAVELSDTKTKEKIEEDATGLEGYAPIHSFVLRGSGNAQGNFLEIMELYLNIKKSKSSDCIICSEISLDLEEINLKINV